jgi:tRNA G18 (ribose-2'-O)-methylase SpoU
VIVRLDGAADPRVEAYRHTGDPDWLRSHGLFVAESRLVVRRLLATSSRFRPLSILATASAVESLRAEMNALSADCDVFVCAQEELDAIGGFHFHRGCLALGERRDEAFTEEAFATARLVVALEGIGNPDNVGGIFRSAAAFRAGGVLLDPGCADPLYRKAIRTSMGAVFRVPFARVDDWPSGLGRLRRRGFSIVALTPEPGARTLEDVARARRGSDAVVVLAGAEGDGLTEQARSCADDRVSIPIDPEVDSLNVTVAVSIALHALATAAVHNRP